ncbi:hypothetical protein GQ607_004825 [Colletotrichum asianum]|uniref:Uncharacterized protein n=1 Tax=Colletotrichum asianum TaxID=702518 RepID=A0A8H3WJC9_9PEZI|nr:hypothetical protein GQ607_004825 [Colletotrichum asianum]
MTPGTLPRGAKVTESLEVSHSEGRGLRSSTCEPCTRTGHGRLCRKSLWLTLSWARTTSVDGNPTGLLPSVSKVSVPATFPRSQNIEAKAAKKRLRGESEKWAVVNSQTRRRRILTGRVAVTELLFLAWLIPLAWLASCESYHG